MVSLHVKHSPFTTMDEHLGHRSQCCSTVDSPSQAGNSCTTLAFVAQMLVHAYKKSEIKDGNSSRNGVKLNFQKFEPIFSPNAVYHWRKPVSPTSGIPVCPIKADF